MKDLLWAGYIIGLINQVGRFERFRPESQVGNRSPSRLFAVVGEVCLDMQIGVASDYLDGPFVGPHRPVRAKPEEFTADGPLGQGIDNLPVRKGSIGNIVNYTDGEMIPGIFCIRFRKTASIWMAWSFEPSPYLPPTISGFSPVS